MKYIKSIIAFSTSLTMLCACGNANESEKNNSTETSGISTLIITSQNSPVSTQTYTGGITEIENSQSETQSETQSIQDNQEERSQISEYNLYSETEPLPETPLEDVYDNEPADAEYYTYDENMSFDYEIPSSYYIDAEVIYQEPELPTGCEITSLAMLLNYWGYDIDKQELSNSYLEKNYDYSCTFWDAFIGNPEDYSGFGCYVPVILRAAVSFLSDMGSDLNVYDLSGNDLDNIFYYIAQDKPVVIWASMGLVDLRYYHAWTTESGEEAWWYENEHCMLLTGYDYDYGTVTVCDPLRGEYTYDMSRFEEIYDYLEQQAMTIY